MADIDWPGSDSWRGGRKDMRTLAPDLFGEGTLYAHYLYAPNRAGEMPERYGFFGLASEELPDEAPPEEYDPQNQVDSIAALLNERDDRIAELEGALRESKQRSLEAYIQFVASVGPSDDYFKRGSALWAESQEAINRALDEGGSDE